MRVLLLSIHFPPEVGANSRIVEGFARELTDLGDRVTVLTGFPHYPEGVIQQGYQGKLWMREQWHGSTVLRTWLHTASRERKWSRIASHLSFAASSFWGGLLSGRQGVLYVYSPPLFLGWTAYLISRFKRIPFVFNVQDIYPEIAIRHGVVRNPIMIRALERFERWIYRKAARVTVISEGFKRNLIDKGVDPAKIEIIPNCVEGDLFAPRPRENALLASFPVLENRFVAMYAGNIGYSQGLETVVEAARLTEDQPEILWVILGDGVRKRQVQDLARSYGLKNLEFLPYQPRDRMPDVLASADVSLVILRPEKSKTTIQSKTYEIMAMERPIVASLDLDGDNWKLIEEAGAGVWARPGDPVSLAERVRELHSDAQLRERLGRQGRRYVETHNTSRIVGGQYRSLLARVAGQQEPGLQPTHPVHK